MRFFKLIFVFAIMQLSTSPVVANVSSHYHLVSNQLVDGAKQALDQQNTTKAIELYQQAMVANPKNINTYIGLGSLHSSKGQYALGVKYYHIALSIDPIDIVALEGMVRTSLKMNKIDTAKSGFDTMEKVCKVTQCAGFHNLKDMMDAYSTLEEDN